MFYCVSSRKNLRYGEASVRSHKQEREEISGGWEGERGIELKERVTLVRFSPLFG